MTVVVFSALPQSLIVNFHAMRAVFDRAHGALERLVDTPPEMLYRIARGEGPEEPPREDEEDGDE